MTRMEYHKLVDTLAESILRNTTESKAALLPADKLEAEIRKTVGAMEILRDMDKCAKVLLVSHHPTAGLVDCHDSLAGLLPSGISKFPFQILAYAAIVADVKANIRLKNEKEE